jgi:hypothetical protein
MLKIVSGLRFLLIEIINALNVLFRDSLEATIYIAKINPMQIFQIEVNIVIAVFTTLWNISLELLPKKAVNQSVTVSQEKFILSGSIGKFISTTNSRNAAVNESTYSGALEIKRLQVFINSGTMKNSTMDPKSKNTAILNDIDTIRFIFDHITPFFCVSFLNTLFSKKVTGMFNTKAKSTPNKTGEIAVNINENVERDSSKFMIMPISNIEATNIPSHFK